VTIIFDSSAMLALLRDEGGADAAAAALPEAVMCAVNVAEVAERLRRDFQEDAVRSSLDLILPLTIAADKELAIAAGFMRAGTLNAGLSLGDRFCLALGARMNVPVLTADRAWLKIADAVGVEVQLIR
jgi:ribonuclease VapC